MKTPVNAARGCAVAALLLVSQQARGGEPLWVQIAQLYGSDTDSNDDFGDSFSVDGDTLVVGAYNKGSGAAYVFERLPEAPTRWQERKKLTPSAAGDTNFGLLVRLSGNTIVVRATTRGESESPIYIYDRDAGGPGAWGLVSRFVVPGANDASVDGNLLAEGYAFTDVDLQDDAGAVFILERGPDGPDDWHYSTTLTASDARAQDHFGGNVSLSGDRILISASQDDDLGSDAGAAYVFDRDETGTWTESVKLLASNGTETDRFGSAVGLDGETAVVGNDAAGEDPAAYIFERHPLEGWIEAKILKPSDGSPTEAFGTAVAISGSVAIVGSSTHDLDDLNGAGAAYIYERDHGGNQAWGEIAKITALNPEALDRFGLAVDLDRNTAVVGARSDDDRGFDAGTVYLFSRTEPLLSIRGSCPGELQVSVIGTTAGGKVLLLGAQREGVARIPRGPCAGSELDLDRPVLLSHSVATSGGDLDISQMIDPASCGWYLQAIDVDTCATSNVAQVP